MIGWARTGSISDRSFPREWAQISANAALLVVVDADNSGRHRWIDRIRPTNRTVYGDLESRRFTALIFEPLHR
jgi:hypothetical protein